MKMGFYRSPARELFVSLFLIRVDFLSLKRSHQMWGGKKEKKSRRRFEMVDIECECLTEKTISHHVHTLYRFPRLSVGTMQSKRVLVFAKNLESLTTF